MKHELGVVAGWAVCLADTTADACPFAVRALRDRDSGCFRITSACTDHFCTAETTAGANKRQLGGLSFKSVLLVAENSKSKLEAWQLSLALVAA